MAQLQFITQVPAVQGFNERTRAQDQHDLARARIEAADWALGESVRQSTEAQGRDIATRRAVQTAGQPSGIATRPAMPVPTVPVDVGAHIDLQGRLDEEAQQRGLPPLDRSGAGQPAAPTARGFQTTLATELAKAPGGGAPAAQAMQGALQGQEAKEEKFLELAVSNPEQAEQFAAVNGLRLTPGMMNLVRNRKAMASIAGLLDAGKALYPGDHNAQIRAQWLQQQLARLNQQAQTAQGVDQAALTQGMMENAPQPAVKQQFAPYPVTTYDDGNQPRIGVFDPNRPPAEAITATDIKGYGRGATATSATERIIQELMASDPSITYPEAVAMARRAPNLSGETLQRERLALTAAKNEITYRTDPTGTLEKWRKIYGLPPVTAPGAPTPAGTPPPAPIGGTGQMKAPDGNSYPVVSTQRQYDALQPGAVYYHAGKKQFLTKGQ